MNYLPIILTGLSTGGLACLSVQGGLLASILSNQVKQSSSNSKASYPFVMTVSFLVSKLLAYIILGALLGLLGSSMQLSVQTRAIIQLLSGVYMILVACNILDLHPLFRYVIFQPPKILSRYIRNTSKKSDMYAPILLGITTIFIPCGTTLAMEAMAMSTGSMVHGSLIMGSFIIGTTPWFMGIGWITQSLSAIRRQYFFVITSIILIYLGGATIRGGINLLGITYPNSQITQHDHVISSGTDTQTSGPVQLHDGKQVIDLTVLPDGYLPNRFQVHSGQLVEIHLKTSRVYSCARAFEIPAYNIEKILPETGEDIITFTPTQKGNLTFSCSMGMYNGVIEVL
ncbi:hypothetical protein HGA91_05195 [candidate division WWE3 bacterium]|nr:hypothetical protein [candidate division WWE3 bacterium]